VKVRFIYAGFRRHADDHPELRSHVPCNEYFGPPSLGIAMLAACTPPNWQLDFRDDRLEDVGLDDPDLDLVAISCFTPSSMRAMELADAFRARGRKVVLGGIFPSLATSAAAPHADAVVVGEGEGLWPQVLRDVERGQLAPVYRAERPVEVTSLPLPRVDLYLDKEDLRFRPDDYPVQLSRGCPLSCSACALPTSMGRKLRHLPVEHVLGQLDQLAARGKLASLTEDTSLLPGACQRRLVELLDALAARERPCEISYLGTSMPLLLAAPDLVLQRLRRAKVSMFYLVGGFDPITRGAFTGKDQAAYTRAVDAIRKAWDHGIEPYTSFLVGNEDDDEGTFDRMLEFADRAGVRKAEFAIMTPYPGTPVFRALTEQGRILHHDFSRYNDANVVFRPKHMTPDRLLEGYLHLWREFYRSRRDYSGLTHAERTVQF
jgi:radical SAM superfamily enzyme YgiQ (UPF0313 family)